MMRTLRVLRWVYLGRLTLASGIFAGALLVWLRDTAPQATLLASLGLVVSVAVTLASMWWTHVLERSPGRNFLYGQVIFDTLLVTLVVHLTGGAESSFPPLYILVIAAGSLLLPLPGGMLIGALASVLYFVDMVWWQELEPTRAAVLQIALFVIVAMATAALGDRLRHAGHVLGEVESELRQLRLDTSDMLAAIDTGLLTIDAAGRLVYVNTAAESHLGLRGGLWLGHPVLDELEERVPGLGVTIRHALAGQGIRSTELTSRPDGSRPDGPGRVLGVRLTLLARPGAPWVTVALQDITETKQIEELIRRADRLEAVAALGASLAHEIRNPLASIRSAVEQLAGAVLAANDQATLRRLVLAESDRLSRLLAEFMDFSRVELRRPARVDVGALTADAIELVARHPDAANGTRIDFARPTTPLEVEGDADLLHRAVFNLVLNAVQHAGSHGTVRVELGRAEPRELPASVPAESPIRISVDDSGPGIRPEDVPRLFDPFFTTRVGGTGLGLALVHRAVEAHHGAILVDGAPGNGARFTVYLPTPPRSG